LFGALSPLRQQIDLKLATDSIGISLQGAERGACFPADFNRDEALLVVSIPCATAPCVIIMGVPQW
jgi:hypothetical protein